MGRSVKRDETMTSREGQVATRKRRGRVQKKKSRRRSRARLKKRQHNKEKDKKRGVGGHKARSSHRVRKMKTNRMASNIFLVLPVS